MSDQALYRYTAHSFDEAVEMLVLLRETGSSTPSLIDFDFSVANLPQGLIAEYQTEAKLAGIAVNATA